MNQDQAKAWLPLIQAVAEGKTLQRPVIEADGITFKKVWRDCDIPDQIMSIDPRFIRIKPEPKKQSYRVALLGFDDRDLGGNVNRSYVAHAAAEKNMNDVQKQPSFIRWLTDRIEYELPEEDA